MRVSVIGRVESSSAGQYLYPLDGPSLGHIAKHLTEEQRCLGRALILPLTLEAAAERVGMSRRQGETVWQGIKTALGLECGAPTVEGRLTFIRLALGVDPCYCGAT